MLRCAGVTVKNIQQPASHDQNPTSSGQAVVIGSMVADRFRPDLLQAGIGDGCHGFRFEAPGGLAPERSQEISVHRDGDGAALAGSPWRLEPVRAEPPAIPLPDLVGQINSLTRERLTNEFAIPGRVDNWHVCNSCWIDPRHRFDHKD